MTGVKISEMTALTALAGSEQIPIVQSGANKSITPLLLGGGVYNVKYYGATGNGTTNDTTSIQAAIDAATTNGGSVYFPTGIYLCNTLTINTRVHLVGDGATSIIKSIAAEPLFNLINEPDDYRHYFRINGIYLDGNNVGSIGLNIKRIAMFVFHDLYIFRFTQYGIYGNGLMIGNFYNCSISYNVVGIKGILLSGPKFAPNLITFINCKLDYNTTWAIQWEYGWMLKFIGCNFEHNGTSGNVNTGAISYLSTQAYNTHYGLGLSIDSSWFEVNYGTVVKIASSGTDVNLLSDISNSIFLLDEMETTINVVTNLGANKVVIRSISIHNAAALKLDGAGSVVVNDNSYIGGTITQNDNSKYYTVDVTEVT